MKTYRPSTVRAGLLIAGFDFAVRCLVVVIHMRKLWFFRVREKKVCAKLVTLTDAGGHSRRRTGLKIYRPSTVRAGLLIAGFDFAVRRLVVAVSYTHLTLPTILLV